MPTVSKTDTHVLDTWYEEYDDEHRHVSQQTYMYAIDAVPHPHMDDDDIDASSRNPMCAVRTGGHQLGTVMA